MTRIGEQMTRFHEYWDCGVRQIIVLEPESAGVLRCEPEVAWQGGDSNIDLPDGRTVPFLSTREIALPDRRSVPFPAAELDVE